MVVGEFTTETDLVVIGGGPAGCAAALRAAALGTQTILVDAAPRLGGAYSRAALTSRMLLDLSQTIHRAERAIESGVISGSLELQCAALRVAIDNAAQANADTLEAEIKASGVEVVRGRARFDDSRRLTVAGDLVSRVKFRRAIIATGSRPRAIEGLPLDHPRVRGPHDELPLGAMPESIVVLGGGPVAAELASLHASLGSAVTLVLPADASVLSGFGGRVRSFLIETLGRQMTVLTAPPIASAHDDAGVWRLEFGDASAVEAESILVAGQGEPAIDGLDLERTAVRRSTDGWLEVDESMRTTDPRILAVGDAIAAGSLASTARMQGRVAAEVVAGWNSAYDARVVPRVAWLDPPVAWCGDDLRAAREAGDRAESRTLAWSRHGGPPSGDAAPDGVTEIVYEPDTGLLLGAATVGAGSPQFIGEVALAIEMGAVMEDLAGVVPSHPAAEIFVKPLEETPESERAT